MEYEMNRLYNEDCLKAMKDIPDKFFDLAIVDPPYGGGAEDNSEWMAFEIDEELNQMTLFDIGVNG